MINIILLTGFLGSGKTTLLQRLINHYEESPIAVIVNEFGEINIDARLLEKDGVKIAELSNGSVFCACIKENFIQSIIEMTSREITYLFIEASGLADPSNMDLILETIKSKVAHPCQYWGSICVLDADSFIDLEGVLPAVKNQLLYAGSIIINKEDLLTPSNKTTIQTIIQSVNPNTPTYFTTYCNVDIDRLLKELRPTEKVAQKSSNTLENQPPTLILKVLPSITLEKLNAFLDFVAPFTYRIKGFITVKEKNYSVSGVKSHLIIMPWPSEIKSANLVLISAVGIGLVSAVADGITLYAKDLITL